MPIKYLKPTRKWPEHYNWLRGRKGTRTQPFTEGNPSQARDPHLAPLKVKSMQAVGTAEVRERLRTEYWGAWLNFRTPVYLPNFVKLGDAPRPGFSPWDARGFILCRNCAWETSLVVQWLRLCTPSTGGLGLIPGEGSINQWSKIQWATTKDAMQPNK